MSTLANIRTKIRRLTGRPSPNQITDDQIDEYIDDFFLYDMPAHLKLFDLATTFEFMTTPNVDRYDLRTMQVWDGSEYIPAVDLYNEIQPPCYVAGYQTFWSQDRQQFNYAFPNLAQIVTSVPANGGPGPYTVNFPNTPILQYQVTVGAIDDTNTSSNLVDIPIDYETGGWTLINAEPPATPTTFGTIDYLTGTATVTFPNNIPSNNQITFTAVPYVAGRPQAAFYYDNVITLRIPPDANYKVVVNAFKRPSALLDSEQSPTIRQWWQYIAYGAAKKIFEDSQDPEGVNSIMYEFKKQETLVLRKTLVEYANQRSATIYSQLNQSQFNQFSYGFF